MKRYFIVGTDTGCGKTYVTCQWVRYLQQKKQRVIAVKPVASGWHEEQGVLINDDVALLEQYNAEVTGIERCPWRLKLPIAPHLAARIEGRQLTAQAISDFCHDLQSQPFDYGLIEGAGGLMVPLNVHETWVDFLIISQIPVILVVGMRLGCINHALLTASVLQQHQIQCAGWVANCLDPQMLMLAENIETLEQKLEWPLLAKIGFQEQAAEFQYCPDVACSL